MVLGHTKTTDKENTEKHMGYICQQFSANS